MNTTNHGPRNVTAKHIEKFEEALPDQISDAEMCAFIISIFMTYDTDPHKALAMLNICKDQIRTFFELDKKRTVQ